METFKYGRMVNLKKICAAEKQFYWSEMVSQKKNLTAEKNYKYTRKTIFKEFIYENLRS